MTGHFDAATQAECPVCGGPCREPFPLPPVQDNYPFMTPEEIAHVNAQAEPATDVEPDPTPRAGRRMRRPARDGARHLDEDRMRRPAEDRD